MSVKSETVRQIGIDSSFRMTGIVELEGMRVLGAVLVPHPGIKGLSRNQALIIRSNAVWQVCNAVYTLIPGKGIDLYSHAIALEDAAPKFGTKSGVMNSDHVAFVSSVLIALQSKGLTIDVVAPDAVKRAIGLDVKGVVPRLKALSWSQHRITKDLKERTLEMMCRLTNLGEHLEGMKQDERFALGDATAVAIAGMGEVQRRRVEAMAR